MSKEIVSEYIKQNAILDSDDNIKIREVFQDRYRVNVWKHNPNRITQSFFVKTQDDSVINCNPSLSA